jgi:hypothetical protein
MKSIVLTCSILVFISTLACSSSSGLAGSSSSSETAIDREARQFVERHFNAQFKKCVDSYYSQHKANPENPAFKNEESGEGMWVEVKDPKIVIDAYKVTDTDRLNGIEWQGFVYVSSNNWRTTDYGKWGKWFPPSKDFGKYHLKKKNGEWVLGAWSYKGTANNSDYLVPGDKPDKTKQDPYTFVLVDVDCSKIPQ